MNLTRTPWVEVPSLPIPDTYPKKEPMSPPRIRHCRLPHPQSTPEQTREKTPLIRSRAKLRLRMLINPSFHQRSRNTTRLCVPCSAPSVTKPARRSVPRADVATGWAEGNHSLTPVQAPSHRSVQHPPPWRRVAHLPSDSLKSHFFFFMGYGADAPLLACILRLHFVTLESYKTHNSQVVGSVYVPYTDDQVLNWTTKGHVDTIPELVSRLTDLKTILIHLRTHLPKTSNLTMRCMKTQRNC